MHFILSTINSKFQLSRSWLSEQKLVEQTVELNNLCLTLSLRFVPSEVTLRRVPTAKAGALFGAKILQVCKYVFFFLFKIIRIYKLF